MFILHVFQDFVSLSGDCLVENLTLLAYTFLDFVQETRPLVLVSQEFTASGYQDCWLVSL